MIFPNALCFFSLLVTVLLIKIYFHLLGNVPSLSIISSVLIENNFYNMIYRVYKSYKAVIKQKNWVEGMLYL